jgi:hypothetical protein
VLLSQSAPRGQVGNGRGTRQGPVVGRGRCRPSLLRGSVQMDGQHSGLTRSCQARPRRPHLPWVVRVLRPSALGQTVQPCSRRGLPGLALTARETQGSGVESLAQLNPRSALPSFERPDSKKHPGEGLGRPPWSPITFQQGRLPRQASSGVQVLLRQQKGRPRIRPFCALPPFQRSPAYVVGPSMHRPGRYYRRLAPLGRRPLASSSTPSTHWVNATSGGMSRLEGQTPGGAGPASRDCIPRFACSCPFTARAGSLAGLGGPRHDRTL